VVASLALSAWLPLHGVPGASLSLGTLTVLCLLAAGWFHAELTRRRKRFHGLDVGLPGARELETGTALESAVTFRALEPLVVLKVDVGWVREEVHCDGFRSSARERTQETVRTWETVKEDELALREGEEASIPFCVEVPSVPSFVGESNQVRWALLVRLQAADGSKTVHRFPVLLRPPRASCVSAV
jgi:hypothetical protein